jgi:hypothetical protein
MPTEILARTVATFAAITLVSLLSTSAAIAAVHVGLPTRNTAICLGTTCAAKPAPHQLKAAHKIKAQATLALAKRY